MRINMIGLFVVLGVLYSAIAWGKPMNIRDEAGYAGWQAARYAGTGFVSSMPGLMRRKHPVVCNAYVCAPVGERAAEHYSANGDCTRGTER